MSDEQKFALVGTPQHPLRGPDMDTLFINWVMAEKQRWDVINIGGASDAAFTMKNYNSFATSFGLPYVKLVVPTVAAIVELEEDSGDALDAYIAPKDFEPSIVPTDIEGATWNSNLHRFEVFAPTGTQVTLKTFDNCVQAEQMFWRSGRRAEGLSFVVPPASELRDFPEMLIRCTSGQSGDFRLDYLMRVVLWPFAKPQGAVSEDDVKAGVAQILSGVKRIQGA